MPCNAVFRIAAMPGTMQAMHGYRVLPLLVSLVCMPGLAAAGSGGVLPDLSGVDDMLDVLAEDQVRQDEDRVFDESAELFPAPAGSESDEALSEELLVIRIGARNVTLRDVPLNEWYAPYVRAIASLQLVSGYRDAAGEPVGLFGPGDPVTVEQLAKVAVLAAGIDAAECTLPPSTLSASGSWSAAYVRCAEERAWAVYSDPAADVQRPATREEVVMTILQAFTRPFDVDTSTMTFTDVEQSAAFAPAIAKAAADGVVSGYTDEHGRLTGMFGPTNLVTRAEFSKIVSIAMQLYTR